MTAKDLIKKCLSLAMVVSANDAPSASEINDGLDTLNDVVTEWGIGGLEAPESTTIDLVVGSGDYHLGTTETMLEEDGSQWQNEAGGPQLVFMERPEMIRSVLLRANGRDKVLRPMTVEEYTEIDDKSYQSTPEKFYYDPQLPYGILKVWPVPNESGKLVVEVTHSQSAALGINTELDNVFSKQMLVALKWTLTGEFCIEYGRPIPPDIIGRVKGSRRKLEEIIFARSMKTIKVVNASRVDILRI